MKPCTSLDCGFPDLGISLSVLIKKENIPTSQIKEALFSSREADMGSF